MEEKFLRVDGNKIRYLAAGTSKNTLVLLHGLGASAERWLSVIPLFEKHFHVIVPDLIGFGYSDKPVADYTPDFFLRFLERFFKAARITKPCIIGSSLGGQLAASYAALHPKSIKKLVLVSPAGTMKNSTKSLDAYIMAAMYPNKKNASLAFELMEGSGKKVPDSIIDEFVTHMKLPNAKLAFMSTILGMKRSKSIISELSSISTPTLLIWGVNDSVIPIEFSDEFVSAIPDVIFLKIKNSGHTPYVEHSKLFANRVLKFLNDN